MAKIERFTFTKFAGMKYMSWHAAAFPLSTIEARLYDDIGKEYFNKKAVAFTNSPFLTDSDLFDISGRTLTLELKSSQNLLLKSPDMDLVTPRGSTVGVCYTVLGSTGEKYNYDELYLFISAWRYKG